MQVFKKKQKQKKPDVVLLMRRYKQISMYLFVFFKYAELKEINFGFTIF